MFFTVSRYNLIRHDHIIGVYHIRFRSLQRFGQFHRWQMRIMIMKMMMTFLVRIEIYKLAVPNPVSHWCERCLEGLKVELLKDAYMWMLLYYIFVLYSKCVSFF